MAVTDISHSHFCSLADPSSRCGPFSCVVPRQKSKKVQDGESEPEAAELTLGISSLSG